MYLNQATASLRRIAFQLFDATGAPVTSASVSFTNPPASGEVQISKAGGAFANVTGSVTEIGSGTWYYEASTTEVNTLGLLILKVNKSGTQLYIVSDEVIDAPSASPSAIAAAVWSAVSEGSETFGGALRLVRAMLLGKGTIQDGDGTYTVRDAADTKNRAVLVRTGTARTVTSTDGT